MLPHTKTLLKHQTLLRYFETSPVNGGDSLPGTFESRWRLPCLQVLASKRLHYHRRTKPAVHTKAWPELALEAYRTFWAYCSHCAEINNMRCCPEAARRHSMALRAEVSPVVVNKVLCLQQKAAQVTGESAVEGQAAFC